VRRSAPDSYIAASDRVAAAEGAAFQQAAEDSVGPVVGGDSSELAF
jgi:hypothetical protein